MYQLRAVGGGLYIAGALMMVVNLYMTAKSGKFVAEETAQAAALVKESSAGKLVPAHTGWSNHRLLEAKPLFFTVLSLVAILVGGMVELIPLFLVKENIPTIASVKPYTPLEVLGRDIYIREGCVGCHSQMIRPFRSETERYGEYSKAGEFVYDHPFLWGSKRTGPDLHREGGRYPDAWHYNHMDDPRSTSPGSIMPRFPWLLSDKLNTDCLAPRIRALRKVGVPYAPGYESGVAQKELAAQQAKIVEGLKAGSVNAKPDREIIALIAYLQRLGTDIKAAPVAPVVTPAPTAALNTK
jgi:cytochrome c oxidase cbb3-type subunit I/II